MWKLHLLKRTIYGEWGYYIIDGDNWEDEGINTYSTPEEAKRVASAHCEWLNRNKSSPFPQSIIAKKDEGNID